MPEHMAQLLGPRVPDVALQRQVHMPTKTCLMSADEVSTILTIFVVFL
jgi:hypothetical protein